MDTFHLKPIETKFQGYTFRSRLEARWAVFFSELGIEYRYEDEGYNLEGTWYLPDFYLPKLDIFIEVKGQEPTQEEMKKAELLALYSGKHVHIFFGNICLPDDDHFEQAICFMPPQIYMTRYAKESSGDIGGLRTLHLNYEVILALSKMFPEDSIELLHSEDDKNRYIVTFDALNVSGCWQWQECLRCGSIHLGIHMDGLEDFCLMRECKGEGTISSPRLIAAYIAARSARF